MNLSNLRQSHPLLLAHMKEIGYSERYIHSVQIEINRILLHEKDNSWNSYQDIYQDYASSPHSERSLLGKATLIGIIAHFDLEGLYPGKHQWHTLWERCVYTQLVPEFKGLVDHYRNLKDTLQICENTVKKNISAISNFLYFLQKAECNSLSGICEQHVLDFFSDDGYGPNKTASHKNCISRVLRACSGYSEYCLTADSFLPHIHNRRKNVQYITQGEISVLREFADKDMFPLRALKMLTAYYSRGCDSKELFKGKVLENAGSFADHLNKYDVIFLNIQQFLIGSKKQDMTEYLEHEVLEELLEEYGKYLARQDKGLVDTLKGIYAKTGKKFIFLIDEWDCVIRERQNDEELQKQYLDFLRGLLKDQPFVALVYMTGILPVKKYGEHSALNMFWEYSMADPEIFEEYTGFTEYEVQKLCEQFDMDFSETSRWYDGYRFRRFHHVYNPRSVVAAMKCHKFSNYWTSTETYEALKVYIDMNFDGLRSDVVKMLGGEPVQVNTLSFQNDMRTFKTGDDVLTLLIHLGYLGYDQEKKEAFIPNREIAGEFENAMSVSGWAEVMRVLNSSEKLLEATLRGDEKSVAEGLDKAHTEVASILTYNDENSLACAISLAYYSARKDYLVIRELPAGHGFADIVFLPLPSAAGKPALIIELKYDHSADTALQQIKDRHYSRSLEDYTGDILLVGVNYDKNSKNKLHSCRIEKIK